jgi:hypothetical protein
LLYSALSNVHKVGQVSQNGSLNQMKPPIVIRLSCTNIRNVFVAKIQIYNITDTLEAFRLPKSHRSEEQRCSTRHRSDSDEIKVSRMEDDRISCDIAISSSDTGTKLISTHTLKEH